MKPFEERYTEWLDGKLSGEELAAFERELPDPAAAEADRAEVKRLSDFLRKECCHSKAPEMRNADFFCHQIVAQIEAEQRAASQAAATVRPEGSRARGSFWSLPSLLWASVACLTASFAVYKTMVPTRYEGGASLVGQVAQNTQPASASAPAPVAPAADRPESSGGLVAQNSAPAAKEVRLGSSANRIARQDAAPAAPAPSLAPASPVAGLASIAPALATPYEAKVLEAKSMQPGVYATSIHSDKDDVTVVWLDGLDYLPATYELQ